VGYDVGKTLDGRWVLRRLLARADHASAFEARHAYLDRVATIVIAEPVHREKVLEEAKLRDRTFHRGILGVLDVGDTRDGIPYLISAPISGRTLDGVLAARGRLTAEEAVDISLGIADALGHLHGLGIAHAALSPASVLLGETAVQLLDVGVFPTPLGSLSGPLASMPYVAPERLRAGAKPGPVSDVYSVAAMLAEMLTGEPPDHWPPDTGSFPAPVAAIVDRGLDDAERRHESIRALSEALLLATETEQMESLPPTARRAHRRAAYVSAVRVRAGEGTLDGRTENIGEGGVLIVGAGEVTELDEVLLRFALPTSGRLVSEPATVRWVRRAAETTAFGVSFDEPTERTLEDIRAYVELVVAD